MDYIKNKLDEVKNSKVLLAIVCLVIGITYTYLYIVGVPYYKWMITGRTFAISSVEAYQEIPAKAGVHQAEELPEVQPLEPSPIALIKTTFPDNYETMIKLMNCESSGQADRIGDTDKTYFVNGRMYGDSIGLFQIRMFPDREAIGATREKLKDAKYNIEYAKKIYDKVGYKAWINCSKKLGIKL